MKIELIIFAILIGALIVSGCSTTTPDQTTNNTSTASLSENTSSVPLTTNVTMKNFAFNPSIVTVSVGDTVQWTNLDATEHHIQGDGIDSGEMPQTSTYTYKFTQAGTYNYTCIIHPSMQGQVIVQ